MSNNGNVLFIRCFKLEGRNKYTAECRVTGDEFTAPDATTAIIGLAAQLKAELEELTGDSAGAGGDMYNEDKTRRLKLLQYYLM